LLRRFSSTAVRSYPRHDETDSGRKQLGEIWPYRDLQIRLSMRIYSSIYHTGSPTNALSSGAPSMQFSAGPEYTM
jgi:hypothetical protein